MGLASDSGSRACPMIFDWPERRKGELELCVCLGQDSLWDTASIWSVAPGPCKGVSLLLPNSLPPWLSESSFQILINVNSHVVPNLIYTKHCDTMTVWQQDGAAKWLLGWLCAVWIHWTRGWMIHLVERASFYYSIWGGIQSYLCNLFIYGIFHVIFLE